MKDVSCAKDHVLSSVHHSADEFSVSPACLSHDATRVVVNSQSSDLPCDAEEKPFNNLLPRIDRQSIDFSCISDFPVFESDDRKKLLFLQDALNSGEPFQNSNTLPQDVLDAIQWSTAREPHLVIAEREAIITAIEHRAAFLRESGDCDAWFGDCDQAIRSLCCDVNGPLFTELARQCEHQDCKCVDFFRLGSPFYGNLVASGNGSVFDAPARNSEDTLWQSCAERNRKLICKLREDEVSGELLRMTCADAAASRMSSPMALSEDVVTSTNLASRFCVNQGEKDDGTIKLRAVDDFSACELNACCRPGERLITEGVDMLFEVCRLLVALGVATPMLLKADIDSAYRRIPISPAHRWAACVTFLCNGVVYSATHYGMPFGAVASVHAWDRVGALICRIARRFCTLSKFDHCARDQKLACVCASRASCLEFEMRVSCEHMCMPCVCSSAALSVRIRMLWLM